ncbi:MAG: peptide chain release factor N(5)-glutamine methyltransferase [Clostridia bacterium]|nr:peptide chain release factor N(5)-glutamine methyltransferase [Clostridia bacterium]
MTEEDIRQRLLSAGVENARHEARLLAEALTGDRLAAAVERRCTGYPLQYLLGEWWFYRESYEVSEDCLIPRADTELLVEKAVKLLPPRARFLDLCTGSGCVAVSTLCARTDTHATAVELFSKTLELAARNGARNGVADRMEPLLADVLEAPPEDLPQGGFDAILSNPPYIRTDVMPTLQREVQYEPVAALCGGMDGLDFYRSILDRWGKLLTPTGFLLLEIGYDQGEALCRLGAERGWKTTVFKDLGGNDRVVLLEPNSI